MLLSSADGGSNAVELQAFLLPFIGALVASGGVIMLNPQPEVRQIVIGRGIFALFFGVLLPQVFPLFHPALQPLALTPAILVLMGGAVSILAYVLSKPFCRELYARAEGIARREADRLEAKYTNSENHPQS